MKWSKLMEFDPIDYIKSLPESRFNMDGYGEFSPPFRKETQGDVFSINFD
jgi:hypothetical protein